MYKKVGSFYTIKKVNKRSFKTLSKRKEKIKKRKKLHEKKKKQG